MNIKAPISIFHRGTTRVFLLACLLSACSESSTEDTIGGLSLPQAAAPTALSGTEKTELLIDASASAAGSYPISNFTLEPATARLAGPATGSVSSSSPLLSVQLPAIAQSATLSYTLTVTDTAGQRSSVPVEIAVQAIDEAPVAAGDSLTAIAGEHFSSAASEGLLLNDWDEADLQLSSPALRAHLVRAPQRLTNFSVTASGAVSFDAPLSFQESSDSFSYRVSDNSGQHSEVAEVHVHIAPSGQTLLAPQARAASIIATENSSATVDASASARGSFAIASYQLQATNVPSSWVGTLPSSSASTSPLFNIRAGTLAQDTTLTFLLTVRDSRGNSDSAPVSATFSALDDTPTAAADSASVVAGELFKVADLRFNGQALSSSPAGNLLLNDRDEPQHSAPSTQLKVQLLTRPRYATEFYVNAAGGYAYRAAESTTATRDSFSYRVSDASGLSAAATVTLTIKASSNRGPTARAESLSTAEKSTVTIDASASTEGSQAITSYRLSHGTLPAGWSIPTGASSSSHISFQSAAVSSRTTVPLTLHVRDSRNKESTVAISLTVLPVEEKPEARGESFSVQRGQSLQTANLSFNGSTLSHAPANNLLLNDRDEPEHNSPSAKLRTILLRAPLHASQFKLDSQGGWHYSASNGHADIADSFSYRVSDGSFSSEPVEVRLSLKAVSANTPPTAANQCKAVAVASNAYSGQLSPLIQDNDDSAFNYSIVTPPLYGQLTVDLSSGDYRYSPSTDARGFRDHFVYQVDDLRGGTATGVVSLIYGALRIMPLGDSITFGVEGYTGATGDLPVVNHAVGYRRYLRDRLASGGYLIDFVGPRRAGWSAGLSDAEHAGFPGWRATELAHGRSSDSAAGNIDSWLNSSKPDVVLIHAGTNDHSSNAGVLTPLLNKIHSWRSNHQAVEMLIASIVDQRRDGGKARSHLDAFNAGVEALVPNYRDASYVDQYSALAWRSDLSSYSVDSVGLHPNSGGYRKMANRWYAALLSSGALNKCP